MLQPYLIGELEGWSQSRGTTARLREVPFPGVPLIFNLGAPWQIVHAVEDGRRDRHDSFVAGLHTAPSFVRGENGSWACIELRLTPLGARRLLGRPMHELTNRTLELPELLPQSHELLERLRELDAWADRFALVEAFLARRFAESVTLAARRRMVVAMAVPVEGPCSDHGDRNRARLEPSPTDRTVSRPPRPDAEAVRSHRSLRPRGAVASPDTAAELGWRRP